MEALWQLWMGLVALADNDVEGTKRSGAEGGGREGDGGVDGCGGSVGGGLGGVGHGDDGDVCGYMVIVVVATVENE